MERGGDPTFGMPRWARPGAAIAWAAGAYAVLMTAPGVALILEQVRKPEVLIAWAVLGGMIGGPLVLALAASAVTRERWIVRRRLAGSALWLGYATGGVLMAHWLPMLGWSPVALGAALRSSGSRADDFLQSALLGLVAWVAVAAGGGLLAWTRWTFRRRVPVPRKAMFGAFPQWLMGSVVFGMLAAPASALVVVALAEERASVGTTVGVGLGVLGLGLLVACLGGWSVAHADVARARLGTRAISFDASFARAVAGAVIVQWISVFVMATLVGWGSAVGQRFMLQLGATMLVTVAVGVLAATGLGWDDVAEDEPAAGPPTRARAG
ncbi:MAG: hypothetical protein KC656_16310 [Myxococcales bacterium]|nr:hypothetical protein [Myxococcales bacterium]MCB9672080.1 hypothetical protein [Alphaproteobacteria bacterium]MCB9693987.1 hypothetical protein [Alphaproteobacteria bacterium]